jgi:proline iminopeptidase
MPSVPANGISLEYESLGAEGAPAIVLVMGLGVQMILWPDELCQGLVDKGFRVVRFDNRDVGLSTYLDHLGRPRVGLETLKFMLHLKVKAPYVVDDMARDTAGLIDALGLGRVHLVGASMGGMISQNLAAMAPEKVATLTSIMSSTGRRSLPGPTPAARRALMQPAAKKGDLEGGAARLVSVLTTIGSRSYPPDPARLRQFAERHVRRGMNPDGVARQLMAIAASGDRTSVVRRIKVPTLVIHGDEDPLIPPACGEETARVILEGGGSAEIEIVPGMGHDFPPQVVPRLVERIAAHCK